MTRYMNWLLVLAGLLCSVPAVAQEVAGRMLVAVGEVSIIRPSGTVRAPAGTAVLSGDLIELGAQSNAQVRFNDESVVALRPDTSFRVEEFRFGGRGEGDQKAVFNLLKGGIRTVTGLIGRIRQNDYEVKTPTSTIGIRGTNYTLVHCDASCANANGSIAPGGTYGSVTEGRIAVTNQSGESTYGSDQFFRVASTTAAPQRLIAPPAFLRDTLEGRARAQERRAEQTQAQGGSGQGQQQQQSGTGSGTASGSSGAGSQSATTVAQTGSDGGTSGDSRVSATVTNNTVSVPVSTNVFQSTTTAAVAGPSTVVVSTSLSGTTFYRATSSAGPISLTSCSTPPCGSITLGDITLSVNLALQRAGVTLNFTDAAGKAFNLSTPSNTGGIPVTINGGQLTFSGTANLADFPTQSGAFRCQACGTSGAVGNLISLSVSGTINGSAATVTFTGVDAFGSATFTANLASATPPNSLSAAVSIPGVSGGDSNRSSSYWAVSVDSAQKLIAFGPTVGAGRISVGSATNVLSGTDSATGLVWGYWSGAGASVVDFNYNSFSTSASAFMPWVTGAAVNTLPTTGTASFTPFASVVNGGSGVLNSASATADFLNRTIAVSVNATNPSAGNTYQANGTSTVAVSTGRFSAGFNSVTCSGPCSGGTPGGSYSGIFAGSSAQGLGMVFSAGFGLGTGVTGVVVMKR